MTVYQAEFLESSLIRTMPDGSKETSPINLKEIQQLEKTCKDFSWNQSKLEQQKQIGEELFILLNGDRQTLVRALKEAFDYGKPLQMILRGDGSAFNLPFELLYYNDFLVPSKIHLIRRVSDRGKKIISTPENRPLKILLMACSPQNVYPVLDFEKEEDTILEVTKDLPIEIDIEDTGSLEGLEQWLRTNIYDIVHITGHADIDKEGMPFFLMENEEGQRNDVTPLQLLEKLDLKMPKLVFLSGCKTGQIPEHVAAMSFAQELVAGLVPAVLGWGLPVTDAGARTAAVRLYYDLSRGEDVLEALRRTRKELFDRHRQDWSLLRLFSDGTPLDKAMVTRGQIRPPGVRELQYAYLKNSPVKVLTKGFIGRRRQMQQGLRCLKKDGEKVGLLLHGTGGLGKSCLAGKICERLSEHTLIIVHGELNAYKFIEAVKDALFRGNDDNGIKILDLKEEVPDKIRRLCSQAFLNNKYIILLDDFERNLIGIKEGNPVICAEAVPILEALLRFLPYSGKMTQLIITSRYTFPLTFDGTDLVKDKLESIGLTSFRGADDTKKVSELVNIVNYPEPEKRQQLINMGHGNPRLMEYLNILVGGVKGLDIDLLLSRAKNKQDEFVEELVLHQLLDAQSEEFLNFLRSCAVYRLPVLKDGIGLVCDDFKDWESYSENAVRLSLIEKDSSSKDLRYWVTPLLGEPLFEELGDYEQKKCHQAAVSYYQKALANTYDPASSEELIQHALSAGLNDIAIDESGGRFLPDLRGNLAYNEALEHGEYVRSCISEPKRNDKWSKFMSELGWIYDEKGNARQAIECYEQALSIDKEAYGDRHTSVAIDLNNIGMSWQALGDAKKAMEYLELALSILKEVYGDRHTSVATNLNNIGTTWDSLGDAKKAIEYYEQALSIDKEAYGDRNTSVARDLNNIGMSWYSLGETKKAIEYYEQGFSIFKKVYGDRHPNVATNLNNIGAAWQALGDAKKAIEYYEQALSIDKEVYGDRHPDVATNLNNIGGAWDALGDSKKAIEYYEQALSILKKVYGDRHPNLARNLNNIGMSWYSLGDSKKAIEYYEQALSIDKEVYGDKHHGVATTFNNIGAAWQALGDSKKAIEYYEQALSIDKEVYDDRHPNLARDVNNIGGAWKNLGDAKKAIEYYEQALSIDKEVYGDRHPDVATNLNNIGGAWDALGDSKKAIEHYEQALSILKEVYDDRHPNLATIFNNIGGAWKNLGDAKKAIEYYEQALSIDKEVYGDRHPDVARDINNIGGVWQALGDTKKAIEYYEQALPILKEVYGGRNPIVATNLNNIGMSWYSLGDAIKAIEHYEQALSIDMKVYGNRHPDVARDVNYIGVSWYSLGEPKKAIEYYEQSLSIYMEVYGNRHPYVATTLNNIGMSWYSLGEPKKAIEHYEQALSILKEVNGDRNPIVALTLNNTGMSWYSLGDAKKAIEYYEQALSIDTEVYGGKHPNVATTLNNNGVASQALGDFKRAKELFQKSYDIFRELYGDEHPNTRNVKEWLDRVN